MEQRDKMDFTHFFFCVGPDLFFRMMAKVGEGELRERSAVGFELSGLALHQIGRCVRALEVRPCLGENVIPAVVWSGPKVVSDDAGWDDDWQKVVKFVSGDCEFRCYGFL